MLDIEKTGKSLPKEMQSVDPSLADLGGLGTESITQTDVETPRLKILEPGSPQIVKGPYRLDDAEAGDFCNTATGDVWRDEITVIPCNSIRITSSGQRCAARAPRSMIMAKTLQS
jgi:hypothetical protein